MSLDQLTGEVPLNIDIFALFIFLGTVQGIFLSYFFLNKYNRSVRSNIYLGLLLIAASLISLDILISYTNVMFKVLYLVDTTEPLNLLVGPFFYLYVKTKLNEKNGQKTYYHFLPALVYLLYSSLFHIQSIESKYNAYIEQYHPELDFITVTAANFEDPLYLKNIINELTIISLTIYLTFAAFQIYRARKHETPDEKRKKLYNLLWFYFGLLTAILFILIFVKVYFAHDLGDYIIVTAVSIFIYSVSFKVIKDSIFFQAKQFDRKYSKSVLDEETKVKILGKINLLMENEKYYLNPSATLLDLAKKINTSPNYVSQVINEKLNLSFLELLAKFRIEEAIKIMKDTDTSETIEGIAYLVGYNSKSTFHSAFKKITGLTPSAYKEQKLK